MTWKHALLGFVCGLIGHAISFYYFKRQNFKGLHK
jgi:hypothetical protein